MNDRYIFILISGDLDVNILHQAKDSFHMKKIRIKLIAETSTSVLAARSFL